jgi:DNA-binding GntR family transcriptional regulator
MLRTRGFEIGEMEAPGRVVIALKLKKEGRVVRIRGVRLASEEPITLMANYLPSSLVPGKLHFENHSFCSRNFFHSLG